MTGAIADGVRRLKDPEYTGENRCLPCTVVNLAIALVLGGALAVAWLPAGAAVGLASLLAIYFRGYLVPGTPTLTKRYLPRRVLRAFGKAPAPSAPAPERGAVDVGSRLLAAGVLRDGGDDFYLTDEARAEWRERIEAVRDGDLGPDAVASALGLPASDLDLESFGDARIAVAGDRTLGRWESRAALIADVAGAGLLADRSERWATEDPAVRGELLGGLRLFLERCPDCDGPVSMGQETVESCCAERDVVAVTCADCGARVLETDAP